MNEQDLEQLAQANELANHYRPRPRRQSSGWTPLNVFFLVIGIVVALNVIGVLCFAFVFVVAHVATPQPKVVIPQYAPLLDQPHTEIPEPTPRDTTNQITRQPEPPKLPPPPDDAPAPVIGNE